MRLRYLIWSNPMILQREPRIGTAPSIYTEYYFLPLFQGPSFWPEPALGGSHVPLLMSPVAWGCPCVRTSVRNLFTPTSHPQPLSHTHPHSSQSHLHIPHSYHLTAMLYPPTNPPLSLPLHMVHSFTPHSLPPLIASPLTASHTHSLSHSQPPTLTASPLSLPLTASPSHSLPLTDFATHSLPHSQPLPLTASHTHSLSPSQQHVSFLPLHTVHPGPWWYQCQDPRYKINQDSWRVALVTTCLPQLVQT